jgi:hypothetical protein
MTSDQNRRIFLGTAAGAAAFTTLPGHVLGGPNTVPPSDKITLAYIGTGTQGLREMMNLRPVPEIQIVAVCDPSRDAVGYRDWDKNGLRAYNIPEAPPREPGQLSPGLRQWVEACKGGTQSPGSFVKAGPISEAVNLYAVALRTGKKLQYDSESMKITNVPEANKYLSREYRKGWDPETI